MREHAVRKRQMHVQQWPLKSGHLKCLSNLLWPSKVRTVPGCLTVSAAELRLAPARHVRGRLPAARCTRRTPAPTGAALCRRPTWLPSPARRPGAPTARPPAGQGWPPSAACWPVSAQSRKVPSQPMAKPKLELKAQHDWHHHAERFRHVERFFRLTCRAKYRDIAAQRVTRL